MSITIKYSAEYISLYSKLECNLQIEVREKTILFEEHKNHHQLKVHKLKGKFNKCLSFSVNYRYRIVFKYTEKNTAVFLLIGDHDIYK